MKNPDSFKLDKVQELRSQPGTPAYVQCRAQLDAAMAVVRS
jgi:hypothetical protein